MIAGLTSQNSHISHGNWLFKNKWVIALPAPCPGTMSQQPTCTNLRIRSTTDAHKIFTAVKQGLLLLVSRRLDAEERLALRSGCIYVWEERGPHAETTGLGIERFTEGRRWSPSRVRDEFLFYYEKYSPPPDLNNGKLREVKPPRDWDPLVKQTYSVFVATAKGRRKWHLTAYFSQATIDHLNTVDDIPRIRELDIPTTLFKSTRLSKNRARVEENKSSDVSKAISTRLYPSSSLPYENETQTHIDEYYQSAEPQSPAQYESPHSPLPSADSGHFHQSQVAYPNENGSEQFSSNFYHRSPIPLPFPIASSTHSKPDDLAPRHDETNNFYESSSSWSNETGVECNNSPSPPAHHLADLGVPVSSMTQSISSTYNVTDNSTFTYSYHAPVSVQNNSTPIYSAPYPLNSGYSPISPAPGLTLPNPADRGMLLSPLLIPARSNSVHYPQEPSSLSPAALPALQHGESYTRPTISSLPPLNIIRRPILPRQPQDELALRLLQASRANP